MMDQKAIFEINLVVSSGGAGVGFKYGKEGWVITKILDDSGQPNLKLKIFGENQNSVGTVLSIIWLQ